MFNKNFSKEPTEKQKIGQIGEDHACQFLLENGYKIVERNYLRKWGELDIVAKKNNKIHFVEVKSVSHEAEQGSIKNKQNDSYRAEDNMHPWKMQRLGRAVQSYLLEKDIPDSVDWQFDVITVQIDPNKGLYDVLLIEDVVL